MSNLKEIEEDETVKKMLNSRSLEPQTKANYCKAIADFCSFFNAKPSEIVEQFKSMSEEEIVSKFADYFANAKDRLAPKSVWGWLPGIKAWLLENGVRQIDRVSREIAREFRRKLGSPKPMLKRDILTSEEIVKILEKADLREKAIITTIASGGFRLSTALKLKLKTHKG
jgi:site-specific recombinase XerD